MSFCHRIDHPSSRREFLSRAGAGFGAVALSAMTGQNLIAKGGFPNPVGAKIPQRLGRAKNVIWLFMEGGPSHLDLFDPKPLLNKLAGQTLPDSFERPVTAMGEVNSPLLECKRQWGQHGESGLWISDWLPNHSKIADELCVIRSCVSDGINHAGGVCQMNTGSVFGGRPALGSWISYGLGQHRSRGPHPQLRTRLPHAGRSPRGVDLESEPEHIKTLYGLDNKETEVYGRNCLLARRLVENGVRFVQLYSGAGSKWDSHSKHRGRITAASANVDKPIAGLLQDLKQRGLLDETLVIWGGEFGRTPMSEKATAATTTPPASPCGWPAAA
jgi:hypothetical protein